MMTADWDPSRTEIQSERLSLKLFTPGDADELFACITPAITRFMQCEPAAFAAVWRSWLEPILDGSDLHFVVRRSQDGRCLGLVGLHAAKTVSPELGSGSGKTLRDGVSAGSHRRGGCMGIGET